MRGAVIAGAGGAIGSALGRALRAQGWATAGLSRRRPADWPQTADHPWLEADLTNEAQLAAAAQAIGAWGRPELIVVATGALQGEGFGPEKTYRRLDAQALARSFEVNAIAPALAAKHLLPLAPREGRHVFAALSARVGSIGDNRLGGWYGYRAAKAALNQIVRCLAIEHARSRPEGIVAALHPGTVESPLSAPFAPDRGVLSPDQSAAALLGVIAGLGPADTGGFFDWKGEQIVW